MKIRIAQWALVGSLALVGCAVEPGGPSPYGYGAPYDVPGGAAYWPSPYYYSPYGYAPYGYAGSTLGFGFGSERWHERDRDWHGRDRDWHREGAREGNHHPERSTSGAGTAMPPTHAAPPPAHSAPAGPAPPPANLSKEKPLPAFRGTPY